MTSEIVLTETHHITNADGLDPITVYLEPIEVGKGSITITCYGSAWTAYFGAMGNRGIKGFVKEVGGDYLTNKLMDSRLQKHTKGHEAYLYKVVKAVQKHLRNEAQENDPR